MYEIKVLIDNQNSLNTLYLYRMYLDVKIKELEGLNNKDSVTAKKAV